MHHHAAVRCARSRQSAPPDGVLSDAGSIPAASTIVYCNVGTLASGTACVATVLPMPVEHLHRAPPYVRRQVRITQGAVVMSERLYSRSSRCCTISMCKGRDIRSGTEAERLRGFPLVGESAVV